MKKLFFVFMVMCLCAYVFAESHKIGPVPNCNETVEAGVLLELPTTIDVYINDPYGGEPYHVAGVGGQVFQSTEIYDIPAFALSYVEFESEEGAPFNPETDTLILTEVWAHVDEPEPWAEEVPQCIPFLIGQLSPTSDGYVTGRSGAQFFSPVITIDSFDLPSLLPGYDLSKLQTDINSGDSYYVTQFTVPANEFIWETSPYFLVDSEDEWLDKLNAEWPNINIRGLDQQEGDDYLSQLQLWHIEGEPYSLIEPFLPDFIPPGLFIYPGGDDGQSSPVPDPDDAGLVMTWGDDSTPDGEKAAAWAWDYGDPDLSNCIITVTATPPGPSGINRISLGMQDINGNIRSWWWNVPAVIPYNVPTTVTIDTTQTGIAAANPPASGFANNPAFNITQVQSIVADENAAWVSGAGAPAPGGGVAQIWNYWHNLSVTPKLPGGGANSKWYVKWSQPPVELEPGLIDGWDEQSLQSTPPVMADDWQCDSDRPVTDIHWWGSFVAWTQPQLPPIVPSAFHIGIWTDVPDPNPGNPGDGDWSHPGTLVWENVCDTSVWNFAGYDLDPRDGDPDQTENEACFQWAQFLSQDEWFHQEEGVNVYWLSIAAIYPAGTDFQSPDFFPWGWKTRPHFFNDDAVRIQQTSQGTWPPVLGSTCIMTDVDPVEWPLGVSWDLAFELTTSEPAYVDDPIAGDISGPAGVPDGSVDLIDLSVVAANWLTVVTP